MDKQLKIKIIEDGPIAVSNCGSINYAGKQIESGDTTYLCRCGRSENMPLCDGTHGSCGFSGKNERQGKEEIIVWEGNTLRTFFNKNICMHVYYCQPLKELRERELAGETVAADEIKQVIAKCPSGALSYQDKQDESYSEFDDVNCIEIVEGGEVRIQSSFECDEIELQEKQAPNRLTLCRCGSSKNKPFCDGRHMKKQNFK